MRREAVFTIDENGIPVKFKICQMSALETHDFITKFMILAGSSFGAVTAIESAVKKGNIDKIDLSVILSLLGGVDPVKLQELTDTLLSCCHRIVESGGLVQCSRENIDGFVSEASSIFALYEQAVSINFPSLLEKPKEEESESHSGVKVHLGKPSKQKDQQKQ